MKPSLPIFTYINIHKAKIIQWCFKFWVHPDNAFVGRPKPHPTYRLLVVFLLAHLVCNGQTLGTSVVGVITDTEITVAADSQILDGEGKSKSRHFCKIRQSGGLFFACAHL